MRTLTALSFVSSLLLSGAGVPADVHVADVVGNWQEHDQAGNFMTVTPKRVLINDHGTITILDTRLKSEGPAEVVYATTVAGKAHELRLRPLTADTAVFSFDGDESKMDRLAPKGTGASDKIKGVWALEASLLTPDHLVTITFTDDQLIGADSGKVERTADLIVVGETADALTIKDMMDTVTYTLHGNRMDMQVKGDASVIRLVRQ